MLLLALLVAGCDGADRKPAPVSFHATDITGADFARDFRLQDHTGRERSLADFRGKAVAIAFGYTHCPDVCPTTLADFALALDAMTPAEAERVQVLFVTIDPERDTPELLAGYVPSFHPSFLGLHGTPEAVAEAAKEFKVFYHRQPHGEDYLVDHSAGSYVFDPQGRVRLYMPFAHPPQKIAEDLQVLLR
ncbi:MAG: SCO family protein [Chromatiales bacterium]|jgi:protein SCO1/2|nr:SCO family protein [Chromatiales bacterium]